MINRKIHNTLLSWKESNINKALLVKGARQVGKTTSIREFGKQHFKNFIEINFEMMPIAKRAFEGNLDAKTIILNLSSMGFGPFEEGKTLVFFDEIQSCPQARTAIKFLVEDGSLKYIESGSLLGINYKDVSSYPVGYEQQISMFPLDFEEFLYANGISTNVMELLKSCYHNKTSVPPFIHEQISALFRQYLVVGGMPEAVQSFIKEKDLSVVRQIQRNILNSYRDDIAKYAQSEKHLAKIVFDAIPSQLSKQNKRFILADIEKGAAQRKYRDSIEWLVDAGIAYFSFNAGAFDLPFSIYEKRNLFKLFLLDIGLLCNTMMADTQFQILQGDTSINQGALMENYIAAELSKKEIPLYYYDQKSRQELDFVFADQGKISIIEVKSSKNYKRHDSLNNVLKKYPNKIAKSMVFSPYNLEIEDNITYYPFYMSMFI